MSKVKICLIGAGSGCFSLTIIRDICLTPNLEGSTIIFMDINKERLDASYSLCSRLADEMGINLTLEKTMDRHEALKGADFVINTALTAPHERLREGWEIAKKHGYNFGGSYHIMYDEAFWINFFQLRFFESLTKDIMEICPQAWHLMVANPVLAGVTYIRRKYPESKLVGLCHGYNAVYDVAEILGFEKEHITFEVPGVNHFVFLSEFYYKGENAFPILDRWIEEKSEEYWKTNTYDALNPKLVDIYKRFGVLPIGDTASWSGASWPWWYHSDSEIEKRWAQEPEKGWNGYFDGVAENAKRINEFAENSKLKVTDEFKPEHSRDPMITVLESLACDIPRVIITNVQNTDEYVWGIPRDFEVEIPTLVSKKGIQGIKTNRLPRNVIAHTLRDRVAPVELELEAYEKGSRELLVQLVLTDKWTKSEKQANELIDDIFALPYHEEMRNHYK